MKATGDKERGSLKRNLSVMVRKEERNIQEGGRNGITSGGRKQKCHLVELLHQPSKGGGYQGRKRDRKGERENKEGDEHILLHESPASPTQQTSKREKREYHNSYFLVLTSLNPSSSLLL